MDHVLTFLHRDISCEDALNGTRNGNNGAELRNVGTQSSATQQEAAKQHQTISYFQVEFDRRCNDPDSKHTQVAYTAFHTALAKGDVSFVTQVLKQVTMCDNGLLDFVVNTQVSYDTRRSVGEMLRSSAWATKGNPRIHALLLETSSRHHTPFVREYPNPDIMFSTPLAIAAASGHFAGVQLLLDHGADVFAQDASGDNILHNLVTLSKHQPELAVRMFRQLCAHMGTITSVQEQHRLAFTENAHGQVPLDIAAKLCLPEMMLALMRWDNVYRFVLDENGPYQQTYYDVSRYKDTRHANHLLRQIVLATEDDVTRLHHCSFIEQEPIRSWIVAVNKTCSSKRWVFIVTWISYIILFFYTVIQFADERDKYEPNMAVAGALMLLSALEIMAQVSVAIKEHAMFSTVGVVHVIRHRGGLPIAFTPIYRSFQFDMTVLVLAIQLLHLLRVPYDDNKTLYTLLYVMATCGAWLAIMMFVQVLSSIGHLLIVMDQLVHTAVLLYLTNIIIMLIFPIGLHIFRIGPQCGDPYNDQQSHVNTSGTTRFADDDFSSVATSVDYNTTGVTSAADTATNQEASDPSLFETIYDTILYGQTLTAPPSLYFNDSGVSLPSIILYVGFLIGYAILLTNMAIGAMSDRASVLRAYKHTLLVIQKLSMSISHSDRANDATQIVRNTNVLKFLKHHFENVEAKYFLKSKDSQQVFLRVTERIQNVHD